MAVDPSTTNSAPPPQTAPAQSDPSGSTQPLQAPYAPYTVPSNYPSAGPSHAPLHPAAQGGFPHTYVSPYGAPMPFVAPGQPSVPQAPPHQSVPYHAPVQVSSHAPAHSAAHAPPFLPPGMPPLMPIPGMTWAAVPNHHLLVVHTAGCPHCMEFVRHYQAAMGDSTFRDALTSVQTQLQTQFWAYFEEHARSREGEGRAEHARQIEELEWQLQAALAEANSLRERARFADELEQQLRAAREEATTLRRDRDRYRSEHDQAREQMREDSRLRAWASQTRPNQARRVPAVPPGHPDFPESPQRAYPARLSRSARDDSPRRPSAQGSGPVNTGSSQMRDEPMPMAGPSWAPAPVSSSSSSRLTLGSSWATTSAPSSMPMAGPSRTSQPSSASVFNAGPPRTPHQASSGMPPASSPESLGSPSRHPTTGRGPVVDFQDFEELSSGEEYEADLVDENRRFEASRSTPLLVLRITRMTDAAHVHQLKDGPYHLLPVPQDSNPRETDHWYNFVPVTVDDAQRLLQATQHDMGQARSRISHLLHQISENSALQGVRGLRTLADAWKNPDKKPYLPTIMHPAAYTPPGMEFADTSHLPPPLGRRPGMLPSQPLHKAMHPLQDLNGPRRAQPRTSDPPEHHRDWWRSYQDRIPPWMERDQDGGPTLEAAQLFVYSRHPIARDRTNQERARWVALTLTLFSVPGLYRHILAQWQLDPTGPYAHAYYPGSLGVDDITVFHVAHWYAVQGITLALADRMQQSAHHARAQLEGMDHNSAVLPFAGIVSIAGAGPVPP
ncbi:uncharacterized protein TRAVEDRAFT_48083, partial [Trametes versicolor FP-101664 SS1]|uniref:uncharacterized protein n=1 Tax=Trametes versicolor (strain FP-101664) TaxID=717944 RepID=UPI0004623DCC